MKIEWTTIESGKNKTYSKINTILENKSKISVFFSENKKHLFGAGVSTMAMAFVVTAGQMSGTEFSANVLYPSLTEEIEQTNGEEGGVSSDTTEDEKGSVLGDMDLNFDDFSENDNNDVEDNNGSDSSSGSIKGDDDTDDTEDLINDLFGSDDVLYEESYEDADSEENNFEENNSEEDNSEESNSKENVSELDNMSLFLDNDENDEGAYENLHSSAKKDEQIVENIQSTESLHTEGEKSSNSNTFKQNFHTVDMHLVAQKSLLKDVEIEDDDLHGSANFFGFDSKSDENIKNDINEVEYVVQKTKKLNQTGPEDMMFGLGFLSMILAYFFRRKKV